MSTTTITTIISDQGSIAALNRGPVITPFTPPASCLSTLTFYSSSGALGPMYFGHEVSGYIDTACYPSGTATLASTGAWDNYYYSPAQCPVGWSHAKTSTSSFGGFNARYVSLGDSTTAVVCCPSGFDYPTDGIGHACRMTVTTTATLLYIPPSFDGAQWHSTNASSASTTTVSDYTIHGDGIPVWWQSSDLKAFSAATGPTPSSSSFTPTTTEPSLSTTNQTSSLPTSSQSVVPSPSGLSNGAKIGLGVGVPLVIIALGAIAFFLYFRRRGRKPVVYSGVGQAEENKGEPIPAVQEVQGTKQLYSPHNSMGNHELQGSYGR